MYYKYSTVPPNPLNSTVNSGKKNFIPVANMYSWNSDDMKVAVNTDIVTNFGPKNCNMEYACRSTEGYETYRSQVLVDIAIDPVMNEQVPFTVKVTIIQTPPPCLWTIIQHV